MSGAASLGSPHGGGPQSEPIEGSLTDGGSLPGAPRDDRRFGAARHESEADSEPGEAGGMVEGLGDGPGATDPAAGQEQSGYGNTPPR